MSVQIGEAELEVGPQDSGPASSMNNTVPLNLVSPGSSSSVCELEDIEFLKVLSDSAIPGFLTFSPLFGVRIISSV